PRRPGLRGDHPQGPLRLLTRVCRTPAAAQPGPGRPAPPRVASPPAAAGDRPDPDPVSWGAVPRRRRGRPREGQGRHQPLRRLRHRVRRPEGPAVTVALTAVAKGEAMREVVKRVLAQARAAGVRARLVLLDRGFYAADVIAYLQAARLPFLMPAL